MAWITPKEVEEVYPFVTDLTETQAAHIQGLCEAVVGFQEEPISSKLKAVVIDIAVRWWRGLQSATTNPAGFESEQIDDYSYKHPSGGPILTGWGLLKTEKQALRRAVGIPTFGVLSLTRGPLETPGVDNIEPEELDCS